MTDRLVVLGRGGAGKSTLARRLGRLTGLPVVELDARFWPADLVAPSPQEWTATQRRLVEAPRWIMDGDLGPYDVLDVRLQAADTVVLLDFSLARCTWRALRRSRERRDFWLWVLTYRRRWRPLVLDAIGQAGPTTVHVLRTPRAVERFVASVVVEAGELRDHVRDQRGEGGHPVADGGAGRREVHHERAARDADEPA